MSDPTDASRKYCAHLDSTFPVALGGRPEIIECGYTSENGSSVSVGVDSYWRALHRDGI